MKELKEYTNSELLGEVEKRLLSSKTTTFPKEEKVEKEKFDVKCSICGEMTQVPFKPRENYPIKCYKCYKAAQNE